MVVPKSKEEMRSLFKRGLSGNEKILTDPNQKKITELGQELNRQFTTEKPSVVEKISQKLLQEQQPKQKIKNSRIVV